MRLPQGSHRQSSVLMTMMYMFFCLYPSNSFNMPSSLYSQSAKLRSNPLAVSRRNTHLQLTPEELADIEWDLAVIGGGPVGCSAALLAARAPLSKKVILISCPRFVHGQNSFENSHNCHNSHNCVTQYPWNFFYLLQCS